MPEVGELSVIVGERLQANGDHRFGYLNEVTIFEYREYPNGARQWEFIGGLMRQHAPKITRALQRYAVETGFEEGETHNNGPTAQAEYVEPENENIDLSEPDFEPCTCAECTGPDHF